YPEIPDEERELADDLVFNRREDALERFIAHFEAKGEQAAEDEVDPTAEMEPEEALHWHILRRRKDGVEAQIDASVDKIGAVPTLNEVPLPAMKEVGDKFGAGELILPFVLQSAEVMKRAVAQLEKYLDKIEGYTKGTVVLATVFGDVHDIGKSLVNTILTKNGYSRGERVDGEAKRVRENPARVGARPAPDAPSRPAVRGDVPIPDPPFWGVREVDVDLDEVFPLLDTHVLFKLHWGGKGVKGEEWERLLQDDFKPRLERMWREQDYLNPRAVYGYFPVN